MSSSFNNSSTPKFDHLLLQSLMGRLQLRQQPPSLNHNHPLLSQSFDDLLLDSASRLSDFSLSSDEGDFIDTGADNKTQLSKEESKLEKELIKIILTRNTQSLKPNSRQAVAIGEHHWRTEFLFAALLLASNDDVSQLLFPDWRNPIEKPFLWLGDFHTYIFLRSFFDDDDDDDDCVDECDDGMMFQSLGKAWNVWKSPDVSLGHIVEQMECGLRLMVPYIVARSRDAQAALVEKLVVGWRRDKGTI